MRGVCRHRAGVVWETDAGPEKSETSTARRQPSDLGHLYNEQRQFQAVRNAELAKYLG